MDIWRTCPSNAGEDSSAVIGVQLNEAHMHRLWRVKLPSIHDHRYPDCGT